MQDEPLSDAPFLRSIFGSNKQTGPRIDQQAPAFRLPEARGGTLALNDVLANGHVMLLFLGGIACRQCCRLLMRVAEAHDTISAYDYEVVAVCNDRTRAVARLVDATDLGFPVLLDQDNSVLARYDLLEQRHGLAVWLGGDRIAVRPTVVLVDRGARVRWKRPIHQRRSQPLLLLPILSAMAAIRENDEPAGLDKLVS